MQLKVFGTLDFEKFTPTHFSRIEESLRNRLSYGERDKLLIECFQLQMVIFVMIGGGMLGESAARQPENFDFDDRTSPIYPKKSILQVVEIILIYAKVLNLNPNRLDPMPQFSLNSIPYCGF